jgi:predicted Zn-dependent protease
MIRSFDNEAELAYVIAQMGGHVASRHVTTNSAKANILQVALQTGTGNALPQGVLATTMAHFSRNDVNEADFLGLQYL